MISLKPLKRFLFAASILLSLAANEYEKSSSMTMYAWSSGKLIRSCDVVSERCQDASWGLGGTGRIYAAHGFGLLGDRRRHRLQGEGANHARHVEDRLGDVEPVVVVGLHDFRADGGVGDRGGLRGDRVALAPGK